MRLNHGLFLFALGLVLTVGAPPALASPSRDLAALAADPDAMKPGQFMWLASPADSDAPISITIDLGKQIALVYRGENLIGISTISSGKAGHETPSGSFSVLQKRLTHRSNLYDDAPMPFMQRLTWDGVALHAGTVPGHPASHGCIRLPKAFARLLYGATRLGTTVTVIDGGSDGTEAASVKTADATGSGPALGAMRLPYALDPR